MYIYIYKYMYTHLYICPALSALPRSRPVAEPLSRQSGASPSWRRLQLVVLLRLLLVLLLPVLGWLPLPSPSHEFSWHPQAPSIALAAPHGQARH